MNTASKSRPKPLPRWAVTLTVLIALVILWGTLKPPGSGEGSLPLGDKQIHALAFALLVLPLSLATPRLIPKIALAALVFGGLIEFIQPGFGRSGEWGDLLADAVGIVVGVLPGLWQKRRSNTT